MENREIADVFERIASLLEIKGEARYRVSAYRRGADGLRTHEREVAEVWKEGKLESITGVGKAIAAKVAELLETDSLEFYEKLIEEVPESLLELLSVTDLGPKKAALFWKELDITDLAGLELAARESKLQKLPGLGEKSEARILKGIEALRNRQTARLSIGVVLPVAEDLVARLSAVKSVETVEVAGSLRRWRETIGDLDLVVASKDPELVMAAFLEIAQPKEVLGMGNVKTSIEMKSGLRVQLWVYPPQEFGAALQYATGSQNHNVRLREIAQSRGLSLSDHGITGGDGKLIGCASEDDVYQTLDMPWIAPELREDRGEIQAAQDDLLPRLIVQSDIISELHAHSDWSDGKLSIIEMGQAAISRGLKCLVISDHSRSLGIANGLSIDRLRAQRLELDRVQNELGDQLVLLQGTEVEITAEGELDFPDDILSELDIVTASLHVSLRQPREQVTQRLLDAIKNPNVDMIGHLSGRLIGRRDPADLDFEAIFRAAAENGTVLEINSHPDRLDLNEIHARRAIDLGCLLAINTDAHKIKHLDNLKFGIGVARRAWLTPEAVLNTWEISRLTEWLRARG
jgi:DNA polymerase (family X)